jgi:hypothetical protein
MRFVDLSSSSCGPSREEYDAWLRAATSTNQADPYCCSPAWQLSFHEAFDPTRRLLIKVADNSLIAFAEDVSSRENPLITPIESGWLFGCPLLGENAPALFAEALEYFGRAYPHFPLVAVSGIRPEGTLPRRLLRMFGDDFAIFLNSRGVQCAASLEGGIDGFLSRRSAKHRSALRHSFRRAVNRGVHFERLAPADAGEAKAVYTRMLAVERASWKGINRCGMTEPPAERFYDIMLHRLAASGEAKVIFARHEDRDIGFIFGGMAGRVYRGQQFSYDHAWKDFSIGNLMQIEQIGRLCEEGAERYDMGPLDGPRMGYKAHWAEEKAAIQTWIFVKR